MLGGLPTHTDVALGVVMSLVSRDESGVPED